MRVVFRVDASSRIGAGHVMRCLALAEALPRGSAEFASRPAGSDLHDVIRAAGHRVHALEAPDDAAATLSAIAGARPDWLVVDHYALGADWETKLRPHVARILALDDFGERVHDCDLLLDQNLAPQDAGRYATQVPPGCHVLAGTRYALLRSEFRRLRAGLAPRDAIRRILVFFGGADADGYTGRALAALPARTPEREIEVEVVIGPLNPNAARLREACATRGYRAIEEPGRLAGCMAAADLAIGAAGTNLWERACLGLPSIAVAVAPNQEYLAARAAEEGIALVIPAAEFGPTALAAALERLVVSPALMRSMSARGNALVDGKGARRVARRLLRPRLRLREAAADDLGRVFDWRNAEEVRRASFDPRPIDRATHEAWFAAALASPARRLLIAEAGSEPMGVLRYDVAGDAATVSIYLAPAWIGRGLGADVLRMGNAWLAERMPGVNRVHAELRPGNDASRRSFLAAGYRGEAERLTWTRRR